MNIVEQVKGLLDVFPKSDLEQKLEEIRAQAAGKDKDIFARFNEALGKNRLQSHLAKRTQKVFDQINPRWRSNYVAVINEAILTIPVQADKLGKVLASYRSESIVRSTIDYPTAAIIQYTTNLDWFLKAARSLAIATYDSELSIIAERRVNETYIRSNLTDKVLVDIAFICSVILKHNDKIDKVIYDLPDLVVNEESARGIRSGVFKTNLLGSDLLDNLLGYFNPLRWSYGVNKFFSELKVLRIQRMEKELQLLELEHQYYLKVKASKGGERDARLEEIIKNLEEEISSISYEIKEKEQEIQETAKKGY